MLTLRLKNWYCWGNAVLSFDRPAFIVGQNGSGKSSSLPEAIEFILVGTGRLRGCSTKKELAAVAIRDDFPECEGTLELLGDRSRSDWTRQGELLTRGVRIRRTMDREGSQEVFSSTWVGDNPHASEGRWSEEEPGALGRDKGNPFGTAESDDLVRCLLEPTHFYTLETQRRQEILVAATSEASVARDVALQALMRRLDYESKPDLEALEDAATWIFDEGFRGAEEAAVEQRKEGKRDRLELVVGDAPEPVLILVQPDGEVDLEANPAADHEEQLADLRRRHVSAVQMEAAGAGALQGKLTEAEEALAAISETRPVAVVDAERSRNDAEVSRQALADLPELEVPQPPKDDVPALGVAAQAALDEHGRRVGVREDAEKAIGALEGAQESEALIPRPAECPLGPPGMKCAAKPGQWKSAWEATGEQLSEQAKAATLDRLRGELTAAREAEGAAREASVAAGGAAGGAAGRLGRHNDTLARIQDRRRAVEQSESLVDLRQTGLADAEASWEREKRTADDRRVAAQRALAAAKEGEQPTGPTADELAASILRGELVCERSRRYWRERAAWESRGVRAQELDATVQRWDAICQELKPAGIETELGGDARQTFVDLLAQTSELSGVISLDEECGVTVAIGREGRPKHPLQLSTSQRLAVGCSIQHALCQLLAFPFLVVDNLETFDAPGRRAWVDFAAAVAGNYESVIGLATPSTDAPPQPPSEPWQTVWLKPNGETVVLGAEFEK